MRIATVSLSQVTAMNLRHDLHWAAPDSERADYTPSGERFFRKFTAEEKARAAVHLGERLFLWQREAPESFARWSAAMAAGQDADPCAFCSSCSSR